jgi:hypothetical protein
MLFVIAKISEVQDQLSDSPSAADSKIIPVAQKRSSSINGSIEQTGF